MLLIISLFKVLAERIKKLAKVHHTSSLTGFNKLFAGSLLDFKNLGDVLVEELIKELSLLISARLAGNPLRNEWSPSEFLNVKIYHTGS